MRAFKNKWFTRWARTEGIRDATLWQAAEEIVAGKVEAVLGKCLYKKRLPRQGSGKSGGYRIIIAYKHPNTQRVFFAYAFPKKSKANITAKEEEVLQKTFKAYLDAPDSMIRELISEGTLFELSKDHSNE